VSEKDETMRLENVKDRNKKFFLNTATDGSEHIEVAGPTKQYISYYLEHLQKRRT